ncbi:unnamed protein product [Sphagnum tenellum]
MRLNEIAPDIILEMAYTRKRAEGIITGLEYPINLHLLKIAAIPMPDQLGHWRHEVITWLSQIAAIRLKPSTKPASMQFYFAILFKEPFEGNEVQSVVARLQLLRQQYGVMRSDIEAEDLVERLRNFHLAFAGGCAKGKIELSVINSLLDNF